MVQKKSKLILIRNKFTLTDRFKKEGSFSTWEWQICPISILEQLQKYSGDTLSFNNFNKINSFEVNLY